jgi:Tfp pilus assembly protein PilN
VTRFNYRQSSFERLFGRRPGLAITRAMHVPIMAIGAALLLVASVSLIEFHRIAQLSAELHEMRDRIGTVQTADARVAALEQRIERLRSLRAAVLLSWRESRETTNGIALIGNALPAQTWLTRVQRSAEGRWSIAGRSTSVGHIGTALARIALLEPAATARLVSINGTGPSGRILEFIIAWEHE